MTAAITVDVASGVPPYEQIRGQVAALIAAGALPAGTRLPVRDLAADLGVAVGAIVRAYRELEASGLVISRRRTGTVVAEGEAAGHGTGAARGHRLVRVARQAGLRDEDVLALVRGALLHSQP